MGLRRHHRAALHPAALHHRAGPHRSASRPQDRAHPQGVQPRKPRVRPEAFPHRGNVGAKEPLRGRLGGVRDDAGVEGRCRRACPATSPLQNRGPQKRQSLNKVALHRARGHRPAQRVQRHNKAGITRTRGAVRAAPGRRRCCNHPRRFHQARSFIIKGRAPSSCGTAKRSHGSCCAASAWRAEHAGEGAGDAVREVQGEPRSQPRCSACGRGSSTEAQLVSKPWRLETAADQQKCRLCVERGTAACAIACGPSCKANGWDIPKINFGTPSPGILSAERVGFRPQPAAGG